MPRTRSTKRIFTEVSWVDFCTTQYKKAKYIKNCCYCDLQLNPEVDDKYCCHVCENIVCKDCVKCTDIDSSSQVITTNSNNNNKRGECVACYDIHVKCTGCDVIIYPEINCGISCYECIDCNNYACQDCCDYPSEYPVCSKCEEETNQESQEDQSDCAVCKATFIDHTCIKCGRGVCEDCIEYDNEDPSASDWGGPEVCSDCNNYFACESCKCSLTKPYYDDFGKDGDETYNCDTCGYQVVCKNCVKYCSDCDKYGCKNCFCIEENWLGEMDQNVREYWYCQRCQEDHEEEASEEEKEEEEEEEEEEEKEVKAS